MDIKSANIINAIHSIAEDHVVAVTTDIYDTGLNKYQSEINAQDYNNITTMQQQIAQIINNPQSGVETYYLSDYALSVNALLAAARNKLAKTIVISDVKTATTHQFGGIAEIVGGNDTSNYVFTETVHGPFIKNGSDLTINPAKNAKANTHTRVLRALYSTTTQAYTANAVVIEDWTLDDSSVEIGDVTAVATSDTNKYNHLLFLAIDTTTYDTVEPVLSVNSVQLQSNVKAANTTIVSNKQLVLNISDNASDVKYSINNVGDHITTTDGTSITVDRVDINSDGTKTTTLNVSVPTTNREEESITKQYSVSSADESISTPLIITQSGTEAAEITPTADDPIGGYVVYAGYANRITLLELLSFDIADLIHSATDNFFGDTQGNIYLYHNSQADTESEVGGILWYASPTDKDYVAAANINASESLIDQTYDSTKGMFIKTGSRFALSKQFVWNSINYNLYTYDDYTTNRIQYATIITGNGMTLQESVSTDPFVRTISVIDDKERYGESSGVYRVFWRINNLWVSSEAHKLQVQLSNNVQTIVWKSDVSWLSGSTEKWTGFGNYAFGYVNVEEMTTGTSRTGHISMTADGFEHIITITQRKSTLTVTPSTRTIPVDPGSLENEERKICVSGTSGTLKYRKFVYDYIESNVDWIKVPDKGSYPNTDYIDGTIIDDNSYVYAWLNYLPNTTGSTRTGTVTVHGKDGEDPATMTVTQDDFSFRVVETSPFTESAIGDVLVYVPFLYAADIDSVTATTDGTSQQATLFKENIPVSSLNYYTGLVQQCYSVNLLNETLDEQTSTISVTVDGTTHTKDITKPGATYNITNIYGLMSDPNTTKYEVSMNGGSLYYDMYTYAEDTPQLVFAGSRSNGKDLVPVTRDKESSFDTSIQPTCTISYTKEEYGYTHYDVNLTFPATTQEKYWALVFGNGERDGSGNYKSGRTLIIKQTAASV